MVWSDLTKSNFTNLPWQLAADDDGDEDELAEGEAPSVTGSNGALYGGKSELFYNQFELYCREQKVTQIILLKDAIHRIKITFNKEFDEVMKKKEQELSKVSLMIWYRARESPLLTYAD